MQSDSLFKLVAATFAELGTGDTPVSRAYWHLEGHFVGYCFYCGDLRATLKRDAVEIEFFDAHRHLLRTVSLPSQEKRDAA